MRDHLYIVASQTLGIAFLLALGFALISVLFPDGRQAVLTIGGLYRPDVAPEALKVAFLVDSAFVFFYSTGLICLAASFSYDANRSLSHILMLAILVLAICDISENRLIVDGYASTDGRAPITSIITHVKYSLVAMIAIGISVLIPPCDRFNKFVAMLLRTLFPLLIAALVVYGSEETVLSKTIGALVSLSFVFMLSSLSWILWQEHLNVREK
ncbi:MAG: hypothetical protein QM488_00365 [Rhizobiaceae bacterium]